MPRSELSVEASETSYTTADTAASGVVKDKNGRKTYKWHKKFAYQKFQGWRPILTPHNAELFFIAFGVLLIALGVPVLIASLNVVEVKVPYAFKGEMATLSVEARQQKLWEAGDAGVVYDVRVTVPKRMQPPIWVAYELGTYFQNFRRYVRSYDPARMHDGNGTTPISACAPFQYLGGDASLPINPCGQIAQSLFNDTFTFGLVGGAALAVDSSSIAWPSDGEDLYGAVPAENFNSDPALRGGATTTQLLNEDQRWMVWMRPHSKVAVQKLYGRIDVPLEAGQEVVISVANRYNSYAYNGAKAVILTTNSWVGGRNVFLGALYLATGGVCLALALFFFFGYDLGWIWKRRYGDLANVSWLRQHAAELHAQQQFAAAGSIGSGGASANGDGAAQDAEGSLPVVAAAAPEAALQKN
ncbi:ALA-interacting subunit 3 [Micractinium conductrix]|uniref:ALA-interacting subunit n=1 Tax=Micractinium conductrix TaxID=554055 RepID=A0A2P6VN80_9CHLO|nr:ALA-interacting subunit 3 [Micractinium conductrix]|eukprot:PSC75562.1 ALA-interacting subunit 3 [Micractinium conductrix]